MIRHFSFLLVCLIAGTALSVCFLSDPAHAEEEDVVVVLTGRLTGYGQNSVVVDREQVDLCENARILDPLEREISTEGLIGTEAVEVTIKNGCATKVKALEIRK